MADGRCEPGSHCGSHPRRIHPAWWVAAVTFLALVGAAAFRAVPGVLIDPLHAEFGWWGPLGLLAGVAGSLTGWRFGHRPSFLRFAWWPACSRYRRWWYQRRWLSAMVTAKLTVSFDGHLVVPVLRRLRCGRWRTRPGSAWLRQSPHRWRTWPPARAWPRPPWPCRTPARR